MAFFMIYLGEINWILIQNKSIICSTWARVTLKDTIYGSLNITATVRKILPTAICDVKITSQRSWNCPFRGPSIITPSLALNPHLILTMPPSQPLQFFISKFSQFKFHNFFIQTILSSTSSKLGLLSVGNYLFVEWFSPGHIWTYGEPWQLAHVSEAPCGYSLFHK